MRRLLLFSLLLAVACGDGDPDPIDDSDIECEPDGGCPNNYTCLVDQCIRHGSLEIGDTCMHESQCGELLTCHNFICKPGCSRVYQVDDCPEGQWCWPIPEASPPAGDCVPSECDPSTTRFCGDGLVCAAFGPQVGGCLPYCEYGFASGSYHDSCVDTFTEDLACQSVGVNHAPVCMAGGDSETGPKVGDAGCSILHNPCQAGSICIDVVCRKLCFPEEPGACEVGESCVPLGSRNDIAYCRAN